MGRGFPVSLATLRSRAGDKDNDNTNDNNDNDNDDNNDNDNQIMIIMIMMIIIIRSFQSCRADVTPRHAAREFPADWEGIEEIALGTFRIYIYIYVYR